LANAGKRQTRGLSDPLLVKIEQGIIWMLTLYPKNVKENLPAQVLRDICKEIENE
jgi:hypothetical protein